jgi:BlaR1 peptidase M56
MAGVPVHVSDDAGPAIVGLLAPHIVVPRWLMQRPPDVQELVIAHEQGHLEAHDARLVTIALGLLVCMPWNLPLWWQRILPAERPCRDDGYPQRPATECATDRPEGIADLCSEQYRILLQRWPDQFHHRT